MMEFESDFRTMNDCFIKLMREQGDPKYKKLINYLEKRLKKCPFVSLMPDLETNVNDLLIKINGAD